MAGDTRWRVVDRLAGIVIIAGCGWCAFLADFRPHESYLSTAAKWGISKLDALRDLFNGNAWMPPGLEPAG
jgi:hypothetical protein